MKIEKGVPIPGKASSKVTMLGHTVRQMQEGDSMVVDTEREAATARSIIRSLGWHGAQRKVADGWRVWRLPTTSAQQMPSEPTTITQSAPINPTPQARMVTPPSVDEEAQTLSLHGLACANRVRASLDDARAWARAGVSEDRLRAAIAAASDGGSTKIPGARIWVELGIAA